MDALFDALRSAIDRMAWERAVELARAGAVIAVSDSADELAFRVKVKGRALPHEVFLWPGDRDWGCDCGTPVACVHAAAAAIAMRKGEVQGTGLPVASAAYQVRLRYDFRSEDSDLFLFRSVVWPDGRVVQLEGTLAESNLVAARGDVQAETLIVMLPPGALSAEAVRRLLIFLEGSALATLDGEPLLTSPEPLPFQLKVSDDGERFKVALVRPENIERLFRGAAILDGVLRPTSHGDLTRDQRQALVKGVMFEKSEMTRLVCDFLPRMEERIPIRVATSRLPRKGDLVPRVEIGLQETALGLEVRTGLIYGDPPVARVTDGVFRVLSDVVPGRDLPAERSVSRAFETKVGLPVGFVRVLPPEQAARFLSEQLPRHDGPVLGDVRANRFAVVDAPVEPQISVAAAEQDRWHLGVRFVGPKGGADVEAVMRAWQAGRSLVPLLDGGYAPLPLDWLATHGPILRELLEARDSKGNLGRQAAASLVELLERDPKAEVPPDLRKLQAFLEGGDGLPDLPLPAGFVGDLRPYQQVGYHWLGFLRQVELNGVLADDMGLGKTVQALAAMLAAGGRHLVVAPTSVLRNWEREANRFTPELSVNVYHGAGRKAGVGQIVLTSYALLRMDADVLATQDWTYVVLDEAQAIKNPSSQTARAACRIPSRYRLALTGTPVENRLEELWSLFRFLMPGFLGGLDVFKERYSRAIEAGDASAQRALRSRVRPYILRRLKKQVATDLPPLTEIVVRCEMSPAQRKVYEAVRSAAREDVQRALAERGVEGSTMQILEALLRMRQACCDPSLLPGFDEEVGSCKLDQLDEMLVELICEDHKALVFSQWTSLLDRVEIRLRELGIPWVRLDGSTRDRQSVVDHFQSPEGPPVFLLSLKAGGTGLNLTAADYVVHLDPWWNPAVQQQATDRAHRIGQDKPVVSMRLIAEGTVEERILELQDSKRALAEAALGQEGGLLQALTADDLRSLFDAG